MATDIFARYLVPTPAPNAGKRERLHWFYSRWLHDLKSNWIVALPVFVLLMLWILVSGALLWWLEGSLRAGIFASVQSVFGDNFGASSFAGRFLYIVNAIWGLLLLGFIVWLFTLSAEREPYFPIPEAHSAGYSDLIKAIGDQKSNKKRQRIRRVGDRPRIGKRRSLFEVRHIHRLR
jgi:hypothetical protein